MDAQPLNKKGVDPAAIQDLSLKGPQYIHTLAMKAALKTIELPSGGGGGSALAKQVATWTVAALHRSMGEVGGWFRRLMFESGGNPRAINKVDSNWLAGHPS